MGHHEDLHSAGVAGRGNRVQGKGGKETGQHVMSIPGFPGCDMRTERTIDTQMRSKTMKIR